MHNIVIILSPVMTDTRKLKYLLHASESGQNWRKKKPNEPTTEQCHKTKPEVKIFLKYLPSISAIAAQ